MELIEAAYRAGVAEAERDIAAGHPKLRYGARGAWGEDLGRTLRVKFGVELVVLSCFTDNESSSFEAGYNTTVEAHVDSVHGAGSVKSVWEEIQRRRKEAYDAWEAEQEPQVGAPVPRVCPQCGGSGKCYCIRKGAGHPEGCVRCDGTGNCIACGGHG